MFGARLNVRHATKFDERIHESVVYLAHRVRHDAPDVKRVADSGIGLSFHACLRGRRMNTQSTTRTAWLETMLRILLGIALVAAVIWAVTDGGTNVPFLHAGA